MPTTIGFVATAMRTEVPIVPICVVGAEEAMPIFLKLNTLQRVARLPYAPVTPTFPLLGLLGGFTYLPAKFKIRFLPPVPTAGLGERPWRDTGLVQTVAHDVRRLIQDELYDMLGQRRSVWFG